MAATLNTSMAAWIRHLLACMGAVQSQRSISSISTSNQTLNFGSVAGSSTSSQSDFVIDLQHFVTTGLVLWNQNRLEWIGSGNPRNQIPKGRETRVSWNATYERLVGTKQRQSPYAQRIPLSDMVEFLVEVWEQEGLYD
ncbi:hypothetical protein C1H46_017282 [Malus baccata]|uniref:Gag1-like clamp domain-containing protein n=1 Tax=Malus baccata TaxID=106549 RepID=A0A540MEN2_MALBA|nr:hypothetical protein C1H46_017282 [Malus baccata]